MVTQPQIAIAVVLMYVVVLLGLGYRSYEETERGNIEDYFLLGRKLTPIFGILTIFATFQSGYFMFGNVGFFYQFGFPWVLGSLASSPLVVAFLWYFGSRFWVLSKKFGHITIPRMFGHYYQSDTIRALLALLTVIFLIPYIVVQLLAGGLALEGITNGLVSFEMGAAFMTVVIIVYTVIGGFRAVTWTDSIQGVFFFLMAWILMVYFLIDHGGVSAFFGDYVSQFSKGMSYTGLLGVDLITLHVALFLAFVVGFIFQPEFYRRAIASKDLSTLRTISIGAGAIVLLAYIPTMFLGFGIKMAMPGIENADSALPVFLGEQYPYLGTVVIAAAIAAMMSTADSLLCTISATVVDDFYRPYVNPDADGDSLERIGWAVIAVSMIVAFAVSLTEPGFIAEITAIAFTGFLVLFWLTIGMFYWDGATAAGGIASLVAGLVTIFGVKYGGLGLPQLVSSFGFVIYTFIVTGVVFFAVSLVTTPLPKEHIAEYQSLFDRHLPGDADGREPNPAEVPAGMDD
ncbi:sodium:solute symporter family protein [Natrinema gelatinilyticum]|uniref:sodium:solute symporter family protein n=1 Tax=Natrinema gelatinilyticum TaxID=2961571 RepID=UPI0020C257F8|nr:sodium:solute symporter family protein [Natrinema gelatinilyticum]